MKKSVFMVGFLLAGCSFTPEFSRPAVETPAQWAAPAAPGNAPQSAAPAARDWWTGFGSAELNGFMGAALADNNDLRAGIQRVAQARAGLRIAGASLLPSADASAGISRARNEDAAGRVTEGDSLRAGAGIAYELDLFGANRAGVEVARANLAGTEYAQDALALVVMGDVAATYFNVLGARERLRFADLNLANAREVLRIVQARVDAGAASDLELAQQKASVSSTEAARASLAQQIAAAENALGVLLGRPPQTVAVAAQGLDALTVPTVAAGQPSQLLERRPDIQAAETDLVAANANIGVARAAFFPKISIGLDAGVASAGFGDPATTALSLASSLTAPLFQGGRLEGGVQQATARQAELAETYRKTVLTAFREVEDALAAVQAASLRENALAAARVEARRAYDLSKTRYDAGAIDFQTLLDTQNAALNADDSYAQARLARLTAAVDLFKALGGGWQFS